jgi:hypothetical protein
MSILAALTRNWNYSIENPAVGRMVYREGNREYTFPIFEEDGVLVLVGVPSAQRIHFFFNWYWHPREFSAAAGARILPRIAGHLRGYGAEVRVLSRGGAGEPDLAFHPELFECRGCATELLSDAGFAWYGDYMSIEPVHEEYGLEVGGIRNEGDVQPILTILQRAFPHWHHSRVCLHDYGREPGWMVSVSMFPPQSCPSGSYDES